MQNSASPWPHVHLHVWNVCSYVPSFVKFYHLCFSYYLWEFQSIFQLLIFKWFKLPEKKIEWKYKTFLCISFTHIPQKLTFLFISLIVLILPSLLHLSWGHILWALEHYRSGMVSFSVHCMRRYLVLIWLMGEES
jgi:hypothetical protein